MAVVIFGQNKMGCASSKTQKQLETGGDLYNK